MYLPTAPGGWSVLKLSCHASALMGSPTLYVVKYLDVGAVKKISKIGLGTWQFGSPEWGYGASYADRMAPAIVRRAVELGVTLFDTAEVYASGRSERILGRALGDDRETVFLATKTFPFIPGARTVRQHAKASAKRLGTGWLDLYQVHWPNPFVPDGPLMRGMRSLQLTGLVREVGVSNYPVERWCAAESLLGSRVLTNQVAYSLMDRSAEHELLPFAHSQKRVIIAYSPLAGGLLSGRYQGNSPPTNRARSMGTSFQGKNLSRISELARILRDVADAHSATPAQIALAWAIRNPAVAAIPGASNVEQLEQNIASVEIELADDEYMALGTASASLQRGVPVRQPRRIAATSLRHCIKGAIYLARTAWHDRKHEHGS
jgi:aryl-alcohol dehydrogenase-like predicted oxidoreductase